MKEEFSHAGVPGAGQARFDAPVDTSDSPLTRDTYQSIVDRLAPESEAYTPAQFIPGAPLWGASSSLLDGDL